MTEYWFASKNVDRIPDCMYQKEGLGWPKNFNPQTGSGS